MKNENFNEEFKEYFDNTHADNELHNKVLTRIAKAKQEAKTSTSSSHVIFAPKKRFRLQKMARAMVACVVVVALFMPIIFGMIMAGRDLGNPNHVPLPPTGGGSSQNPPQINVPPTSIRPPVPGTNMAFSIEGEEELNALFEINDYNPRADNDWGDEESAWQGGPGVGEGGVVNADRDNVARPPGTDGSSTTNIQVQGMDEGDIVRNDGRFIYRLSTSGLTIVETYRGQVTLVFSKQYTNFAPIEMFTHGNRMVILGGTRENPPTNMNMSGGGFMNFARWHNRTQIRVYDITNPSSPILERFFEIDGVFNTSRIQQDTDTLFFVINFWPTIRFFNQETHQWETRSRLPYFRTSETAEFMPLPYRNIFYTIENARVRHFMLLGSIDLFQPASDVTVKGYLANTDIISVSRYNLYTSTTRWEFEYQKCEDCYNCDPSWLRDGCMCRFCIEHRRPQGCRATGDWVDRSHIARFCLETLYYSGTAVVMGTPLSRHAIDEYRGYLRVATTYGAWWQSWNNNDIYFASAVFVFNYNLEMVSYITGIAVGETMDSATFTGNFGYISTSPPWLIWDPLYTVNLTDPYNITISEGLETDGINQFLKAIPGTGLAIGIGQDASPEGAAWQTGIKIELYDMKPGTGLMPVSLAKYTIYGEGTWAEILWNSRSLLFMFDEETLQGVVGFAAEVSFQREQRAARITPVQGFYLWAIDGKEGTLTFLGNSRRERITRPNVPTPGSPWVWETVYVDLLLPTFSNFNVNYDIFPLNATGGTSWQDRWDMQWAMFRQFITRGVINNGYLYTVSDNVITGYDLRTMQRISRFVGV